jgi:hypothetical protein
MSVWFWLLIGSLFVLLVCAVGVTILAAAGCGVGVVSYLYFMDKRKWSRKMDQKMFFSFVGSAAQQIVIRDWAEALRARVGNKEAYKALVLNSNNAASDVSTDDVRKLFEELEVYARWMAPGHDIGHFRRDGLDAMMLFDDIAGHPADKLAGVIAGWAHDVGNSVTPRYQDRTRNAGHTAVSAWVLSMVAKDLLPEGILDLATYAVLAHGHVLKPMDTTFPEPFSVLPYWDELWYEDGLPFGLAIRFARWADRMDTCGLTQGARHVISRCDAREEKSFDLADANTWVEVGGAGLKACFIPTMGNFEKVPTLLQHLRNYQSSYRAFGSPYASQDFLVPGFGEFTRFKFQQLDKMVGALEDYNISPLTITGIKQVLMHISGAQSGKFDQAWEVFILEWNALTEDQRDAWARVYAVMGTEYEKLLANYLESTVDSTFAELARETIAKLLMQ